MKTLMILLFACSMAFAGNTNDMKSYIEKSGKEPAQYVADKFKVNDVVIFSEIHKLKHEVEFVKSLIPVLGNSGVYNIAIEFGNAKDQVKMDKLLSGNVFDNDLAMEIMRNFKGNGILGYREYMDLYKTVWEANRTNNSKFKIILMGNTKQAAKFSGKSLVLASSNMTKDNIQNACIIKFHTAKQKDMNEVYDILTNKTPVAFDLTNSPIKTNADGYIFLKSPREFEPLTWIDGFINDDYLPVVKNNFKHLPLESIDYATEVCKACDWSDYESQRGTANIY
jgi:hypothetical protein